MSANTFGNILRITSFGESHGVALGAVIDGCPAGLEFDLPFLQIEMDRRKPGQGRGVSQRQEADRVEILSGVFEGKTLGTPVAMIVRNQDARSADYDQIKSAPRAGHADDLWKAKFGHSDHRGGGRSSGRETVARVMGGAVGKMILQNLYPELKFHSYASQIGPHSFLGATSDAEKIRDFLVQAQERGESFGGTATLCVKGLPAGLGQPVFHKLKSDIAQAMMSVGATSGFEIGDGIEASQAKGSEFHSRSEDPYGGLRGGISTGDDLVLRVSFKPTSSLLDVAKKGRHDPCIVPRAIPVLESMLAFVLADHALWRRLDRID